MIYTVTLNPTVDRMMRVPRFAVGGTFKALDSTCQAAGKGINVARVVATLGEPVVALGLVGRQDEALFGEALSEAEIGNRLVPVPGPTRISVTILDPTLGTGTHLREQGSIPPAGGLDEVISSLGVLSAGDWVVLSGSLPPGMAGDVYRVLIEHCQEQEAHTMLDSSGSALLAAIDARPTVVKPNLFELWQIDSGQTDVTWERDLDSLRMDEIWAAARRVCERGVRTVVVSLGARGVLGLEATGQAYRASVRNDRRVVDAVGSGDALAAGLVVSFARGEGLREALRLGVACGTANTLVVGAGCCRMSDIEYLSLRTVVTVLPPDAA